MDTQIIEKEIRKIIDTITSCKDEQFVVISLKNDCPQFIYKGIPTPIRGKLRFMSYAYEDASGWVLSKDDAQEIADTLNKENKDLDVNFAPFNALVYFTKNLISVHNMNLACHYPSHK